MNVHKLIFTVYSNIWTHLTKVVQHLGFVKLLALMQLKHHEPEQSSSSIYRCSIPDVWVTVAAEKKRSSSDVSLLTRVLHLFQGHSERFPGHMGYTIPAG